MSNGVIYIAYGWKAQNEAKLSIETVKRHNEIPCQIVYGDDTDNVMASRRNKTRLYDLTRFDNTLYLDADTRVHDDVSIGFDLLNDGWEVVIVPSENQGASWLWHVDSEEREETIADVGYQAVQWQCGVMWFRRTSQTQALFAAWWDEWKKRQGQDQAAFIRALHRVPVKLYVLGFDFNGGRGSVIQHCFGRARA